MKNSGVLLILSVIIALISSCQKDPVTVYDFSKYTVTDSTCAVTGTIDATDWSNDSIWTSAESGLLSFYYADTLPQKDTLIGYIQMGPACPNPSPGAIIIGYDTERGCKLKFVCVNTALEILHYENRILTGGPGLIALDFSSNTSFKKNENYRVYYGFYNTSDSLYYKGHGDFRIQ